MKLSSAALLVMLTIYGVLTVILVRKTNEKHRQLVEATLKESRGTLIASSAFGWVIKLPNGSKEVWIYEDGRYRKI